MTARLDTDLICPTCGHVLSGATDPTDADAPTYARTFNLHSVRGRTIAVINKVA